MIITKQYSIGHIGKTGGRALKQIWKAVDIPFKCSIDYGHKSRHARFHESHLFRKPTLALTIRRLPHRELSWNHEVSSWGRKHKPWRSPDEILEILPGENELVEMLKGVGIDGIGHWLRCEHLIDDAMHFISMFHGDHERPTLQSRYEKQYDHDIWSFFDSSHVRELYHRSPTWSMIEEKVYGSLVI